MCGENSVTAVETQKTVRSRKGAKTEAPAITVTVTKFLFTVDENGMLSTHHTNVRQAAHLRDNVRNFNANVVGGKVNFENGVPEWADEAEVTKRLISLEKKLNVSIPSYVKKVAAARKTLATAIAKANKLAKPAPAIKAAEKAFAASKKAAFATLAKLGGIAL